MIAATALTFGTHPVLGADAVEPKAAPALTQGQIDEAFERVSGGIGQHLTDAVSNAHWVDSSRIAFVVRDGSTATMMLYDMAVDKVSEPLNLKRLAKRLSAAIGSDIKADELPIHSARLQADGSVHLSEGQAWYNCDRKQCVSIGPAELYEGWPADGGELNQWPSTGPVFSPDGKYGVDVKAHNLVLIDQESKAEAKLTSDGTALNAYGNGIDLSWAGAHVLLRRMTWQQSPSVLWSPDSKRFVTFQLDVRKVRKQTLIDTASYGNPDAAPVVYEYPYAYAGDSEWPRLVPVIVDVASGKVTRIDEPSMIGVPDIIAAGLARWSLDSARLNLIESPVDGSGWSWWSVQTGTGAAKKVYTETFGQVPVLSAPPITPLSTNGDMIIWSLRDDLGHLFRYDAQGNLLNAITSGNVHVVGITQVIYNDAEEPWIYFMAGEERNGANPYDFQLYRVRADGSGQDRISSSNARHQIEFSSDQTHYISVETRADQPKRIAVYKADGQLVHELGKGRLKARDDIHLPERFRIDRGDPGRDVFGVLYRPANIEPGKQYPLVHYVYGAAYSNDQPTRLISEEADFARGLNALGIGVVFYDGQGTTNRRYSFNRYPDGKGYEHCNLADAQRVIGELANRHAWIDPSRVGVAGWSNGGYCSMRAMLDHPDVYKAAVSIAGNHDQKFQHFSVARSIDTRGEGDLAWERQSNIRALGRLQGPVLLIQGEIDESVMPINTLRVVEKLTQLGKPFEMLYLPGEGHALANSIELITKKQFEFLYNHLVAQ